jgi:hypothetical protein
MTDWKRSITIGLGPSSPRRATTGCEAGPESDSSGALPSCDDASRAAAGRAEVGVHSLAREPEARGASGVSGCVQTLFALRQP